MLVEITGRQNEEVLTTSSREVSVKFEKEHSKVLRSIDDLISEKPFLDSLNYFIPTEYSVDGNNRKYKEYLMTRDGFTLLAMGFTGTKSLDWKLEYIAAFNCMETELKRIYKERQQWEIERAKGILVRHILTDTIKMKVADSPHKRFAYPNYTKLIYKTLFRKPLNDLQIDYGVKPKESIRDYLTSDQLRDVENMEMLVSSLINCGWGYEQIKGFIQENSVKKVAI